MAIFAICHRRKHLCIPSEQPNHSVQIVLPSCVLRLELESNFTIETVSKMFRSLMEDLFLETGSPLYGHVGNGILIIQLTEDL